MAKSSASLAKTATRGTKPIPIKLSAGDLARSYGPPPYAKPDDVPPMSRAYIAMFVTALTNAIHKDEKQAIADNLKVLEQQAASGMLPPGCFKAWGLPEHPIYAHLCASNEISTLRANHHLTALRDRIAFVRHCRNAFKKKGHCDAANVLTRFLMIIEQSNELLGNGKSPAFDGLQRAIVDAAYQWVYAYAKGYGLGGGSLLDYVPTQMDHEFERLQQEFSAMRFAHTNAPEQVEIHLTAAEPRQNAILTPEAKQKTLHVAKRVGHHAARAGRGAAGMAASITGGLSDIFAELAKPAADHHAAKPARKNRSKCATGDYGDYGDDMRDNVSTVTAGKLSAAAQKSLNDYAKAHGYNYVHAQVMSPRKVEAYLLQQEGDNFGLRVVATASVLGRWEVKPFSPAKPRRNLSPAAMKTPLSGPSQTEMVSIAQDYLSKAPPKPRPSALQPTSKPRKRGRHAVP